MGNPLKSKVSPALFWGMVIGLSGLSMLYLMLQGYFATNETAKTVGSVMMFMAIFGIILSAGKVFFTEKHFLASSQAWLVGFVSWLGISSLGGSKGSVLTMNLWSYFGTVSLSNLPGNEIANTGLKFWEWYVPNITSPINEEMMWGVGLPIFLIMMMDGISKQGARNLSNPYVSSILRFFGNPVFQLVVLLTVVPLSFAIFHIGKQASLIFLVSAITFRSILMVLWFGDLQWEIIPFLLIVPAFLVGAHMGNNIGVTGFSTSMTVATSHPVGWATIGIFGFISFVAILGFIEEATWLRNLIRSVG